MIKKNVIFLLNLRFDSRVKVSKGLASIYGVGRKRSEKLLKILGVKPSLSFEDLEKENLKNISLLFDFLPFSIRNELKVKLKERWQSLLKAKAYRALRRRDGFPARGQRTRTNARTARKRLGG